MIDFYWIANFYFLQCLIESNNPFKDTPVRFGKPDRCLTIGCYKKITATFKNCRNSLMLGISFNEEGIKSAGINEQCFSCNKSNHALLSKYQ